ncbi:MAG: hypothetical protein WBW58_14135, partial [Candidatus Acidiferrum sp.]
ARAYTHILLPLETAFQVGAQFQCADLAGLLADLSRSTLIVATCSAVFSPPSSVPCEATLAIWPFPTLNFAKISLSEALERLSGFLQGGFFLLG